SRDWNSDVCSSDLSRRSALALRWASGLVVVEEEVAVDGGGVAVEHGGEEFVAVGHHAAVVAGRVLGDGDLGVRRDQVGVAGSLQEVIQAGEHLVPRRVFEEQTSTDAAANGLEVALVQAVEEPAVAGEDHAEERTRVELLAGEDAQLAEHP